MKWIGLTGGIGTGKSTVSEILHQKGLPILNADAYAHEALKREEVIQGLLSHFSEDIISTESEKTSKGMIDRKTLGDIVFTDPHKKSILENILHPIIKTMVDEKKKQLEQSKVGLAIYEVPLLFEKDMQAEFDCVLLVAADRDIIYERLKKDRSLTEKKIDLIINSQMPQEEKLKLTPFVIWNNAAIKELEMQCEFLLKKVIGNFKNARSIT